MWAESLLTLAVRPRWSEQLAVYPRTNKQNPKKKRKVEPVATQVEAKRKTGIGSVPFQVQLDPVQ